ncbi:DUF4834 family protein [Algoriphagus lacus]|uniref:DUF4834 family protein n=1 Tax=Algoriphagus lacus TaxID=2056311 RepID=A0A418PX31_9BACT|nr:DUF4834 family protein [Algoriphagus lacus]RIW18698.1 DUF4834 family protein [Algoriphagus lacus]
MFKFLLIFLGVGWLLGQLIRYFLRSKLAQFAKQVNEAAMEQQRAQKRAQSKSDVNVDFVPRDQAEKRRKDLEGGEYIDYEEVKE